MHTQVSNLVFGGRGVLRGQEAIRNFVLGGKAIFTLLNTHTGRRLTYKVYKPRPTQKNEPDRLLVLVLTGPNNETDYQFLGIIFDSTRYFRGRSSRISESAQSAKVFAWFWRTLANGGMPDYVEFWHEGRCGRCGRRLTVPESLATGVGPACAGTSRRGRRH